MPHEHVTVDEAVVPFKGCRGFKQFTKDRPMKSGIKLWVCYTLEVYTGKQGVQINTGKQGQQINTGKHGQQINTGKHGQQINTGKHGQQIKTDVKLWPHNLHQ